MLDYDSFPVDRAEDHAARRYIICQGKIYKSKDLWLTHQDLIEKYDLPYGDITDMGYIMPDGSYYSFIDHDAFVPKEIVIGSLQPRIQSALDHPGRVARKPW